MNSHDYKGRQGRQGQGRQDEASSLKCQVCSDLFLNPNDLKTHYCCFGEEIIGPLQISLPRLDFSSLECKSCQKIFHQKKALRNHRCPSEENQEKPDLMEPYLTANCMLRCKVCPAMFHGFRAFHSHVFYEHSNMLEKVPSKKAVEDQKGRGRGRWEFSMSCKACLREFSSKRSYNGHLKHCKERQNGPRKTQPVQAASGFTFLVKDDGSVDCLICQRKFSHKRAFNGHLHICKDNQNGEDTPISCIECKKEFRNKRSYNGHFSKCPGRKNTESQGNSKKRSAKENGSLVCQGCQKEFLGKQRFLGHTATCKQSLSKTQEKSSSLKCKICLKTFSQKWSLQRHWQNVHESHSFPCEKCGKDFKSHVHLNKHIQNQHTENARLDCENCGRNYKNLATLKKHKYSDCKAR